MADFEFLQNPVSKKWIITAPKRAKRPNEIKGTEPMCPFCPGKEAESTEVDRRGGEVGDAGWKARVINNKYPFAPIHELIIHSQDHHKGWDELPVDHNNLVLSLLRKRYNENKDKGQVYIFFNHGPMAGESLSHPHTQLVVIDEKVKLDLPLLEEGIVPKEPVNTDHFTVFSPLACVWPDEVWVSPKRGGLNFGQSTDEELVDLAKLLYRAIQIMDLRHGSEFPFNFYIYPGKDWYLRLIPRVKIIGGFEVGTGVFVNTQDPSETNEFLKTHFIEPDIERIKTEHRAKYRKRV